MNSKLNVAQIHSIIDTDEELHEMNKLMESYKDLIEECKDRIEQHKTNMEKRFYSYLKKRMMPLGML